MLHTSVKKQIIAAGLVLSLCGCASTPPAPTTLLQQVESDMATAKELDAEQYAPLVYHEAQEHLTAAKAYLNDEENTKANFALQKAQADLELAMAKSRAAKQEKAAQEVENNLDALRQAL